MVHTDSSAKNERVKSKLKQIIKTAFILLVLNCSGKNIKGQAASSPEIKISDLLDNIFYSSSIIHGLTLKFDKKKLTYDFDFGSEGLYWHDIGKFTIIEDRIELKPTKCEPKCSESFGVGFCAITDNKNSYSHKLSLECQSKSNGKLLTTGYKNNKASFKIYSEGERS
ncbi:hypothetical protein CH373_06240 [Leptospira perolatii]|uniref:Uncharacterized protein n=1 Tax=Leptospira perolatii TaxID=2023191 RepID=A0A2M9ZP59_9LEPT|nr:hypothetical protein [Leptospira perolatii]PJZ70863.1 hypothetical protein CH360_04970 [Leptospira perolatii]PJZ73759.1 hypothetical protein CH373_06240 [Leptospira perolatii]